ncbi:NADH dehydrogenase [ubiquinone] 1 subunit C2-like protein [Dinothrombium tinctorium]|uniref:NADH dehydrogenase [ubiquinone] 1 subunit C2-like protein n=1 Tax=Dinothrombium tinctorium TaxID=1965070 RepID=A0A3S3P7Z2_9ACAR|nr:NADH dehydrogenase [ubiquinone] 1 subunit C2-like protein [Dinothrombium tinctorium]RWS14129.1 NADH dehydrogenase [ubiquinone] 1 subunit C2-like protein [Dinothrombium tinctorium]
MGRFISTPEEDHPTIIYRKPSEDEVYVYDPNWKESHYGMGRLGPAYHPLDPFRKFDNPPSWHIGAILLPFICTSLSFLSVIWSQHMLRRPLFSQIWKHASMSAFGFGLGVFAWKRSRYRAAVRDATLQHYIELHPEDFPIIGIAL